MEKLQSYFQRVKGLVTKRKESKISENIEIEIKSVNQNNGVENEITLEDSVENEAKPENNPENPEKLRDIENLNENENSENKNGNLAESLSKPVTFISFIFIVGIAAIIAKVLDLRLATPLYKSEINTKQGSFIEELARENLLELTQFGPRVTGDPHTDTIAYKIAEKLEEIRNSSDIDIHNIEIDISKFRGGYLDEDNEGFITSYSNFINVVAKIENRINPREESILLNCHYDTKPDAPGATDNMISCVTMLEILRVLASQNEPIKNTIVFLFNGGEELGLSGAHAFAAGMNATESYGHPWMKGVKGFLNLEGAGSGGRPILFQTTPGNRWLLRAYKSAVNIPYGSVVADEAFQEGLIPSDTDFRMFKEFGNVPGLDMSFIKNGYVYHTKWDLISEIPPGSIQEMGNNALGIVQELNEIDLNEAEREKEHKMVFYDFIGLFMVTYTEGAGKAINVIVAIIAFAHSIIQIYLVLTDEEKNTPILKSKIIGIILRILKEMAILITTTLLAWVLAIGLMVLNSFIFYWTQFVAPYFSYPYLPIVLFGIPAILITTLVLAFVTKGSIEKSWVGGQLVLSLTLFALTFLFRASYIFMICLLFRTFAWVCAQLISIKIYKASKSVWLGIYLIVGELIPLSYSLYLVITLLDVFIPIFGRSGSNDSPEGNVPMISAGMIVALCFSGLTGILVIFRKRILLMAIIFLVLIVNPLIVYGIIGRIPYREKTSMRLMIFETERSWFDRDHQTIINHDAGFVIWPTDPNTDEFMEEFHKTVEQTRVYFKTDLDYEHCPDLYCAIPQQPWTSSMKRAIWIPKTEGLPANLRPEIQFRSRVTTENGVRRVSIEIDGPSQLTLVLSPNSGLSLSNCRIFNDDPIYNIDKLPDGWVWKGRKTYFFSFQRGSEKETFHLSCSLNGNPNLTDFLIEAKLDSQFMHGPNSNSEDLQDFSSRFPNWTTILNYIIHTDFHYIYQ